MAIKQFPSLRLWLLPLIALFLLSVGRPAAAQEGGVTDDDVNDVARQLFCPTCATTPVDVCPTQVCADWREEIRNQLAAGRTEQQILEYFSDRYGEGVLANPPASGFGLLVWIAPVVIFLAGVFVFARYLRVLRQNAAATGGDAAGTPAASEPADPYLTRLEQELDQE